MALCVPLTRFLKTMPKSELDRPNNSSNVFRSFFQSQLQTQKEKNFTYLFIYYSPPPPKKKNK